MIRLLSKSDIDSKKALERKQEMDEGMKLAKRVDALRETVADEEASLELFRRKTITAISTQISKAEEKLALLKEEVATLEERRAQALKPLDTAWNTLKQSQQEHTASILSLEKKQQEYLTKSKQLQEQLIAATEELARIEGLKKQTEDALLEASENKKDTEASLAYTRTLEHDTEALSIETLAELRERDAVCAAKERDVSIRDEALTLREEALHKAQIVLDDRNAMLERDITRFMKQQNESNSPNRK